MVDYPVDIVRKSSAEFLASWTDFPDIPPASATTPDAAFHNLIDGTFGVIAELVSRGENQPPSPANGRPTVTFGDAAFISPHIGNLIQLTTKGTWMLSYSWTNDSAYIE